MSLKSSSSSDSHSTSSSDGSTSSSGSSGSASTDSDVDMSEIEAHLSSKLPLDGKFREPLGEKHTDPPEPKVDSPPPRKIRTAESTRSNLTRQKIKELLTNSCPYRILYHVPEPCDRITSPPLDSTGFYATVITLGVDPPIHPFFISVLDSYGIAPAQLNPFAWCHMMGALFIWSDLGFGEPSLNIWHHLYKTTPIKHHPQFYYFNRWPKGRDSLIKLPSTSSGGWRERFFFLDVTTGGRGLREEFSNASG